MLAAAPPRPQPAARAAPARGARAGAAQGGAAAELGAARRRPAGGPGAPWPGLLVPGAAALALRWRSGRQPRAAGAAGAGRGGPRRRRVARAACDVAAWRKGFQVDPGPATADGFYAVESDAAGVPEGMVGTFFWVTPGRFSAYGKYVCHPLDGDGLALAITFDAEGRVFVRHRLVQTQGLLRDDTLEATCSNGVHGTPGQGWGPLNLRNGIKNPANANVCFYEDRLLATWPYGSPYNLDPGSLATLIGADDAGSTDLGGLLLPGKPLSTFGPRPKLDPKGTITSYGVKPDLLGTRVNIYEARESWRSRYPKTAPRSVGLPGYSWVTDSASTPRWAVLAVPPCKADAFAAAQGKHPAQVLSWDEGASGALVFATRAKEGSKEATVKLDGRAVESIANAFEAEGDSGRVTVDAAAADGWVLAPQAPEDASPERPFWEVLSPDSAPRAQLVRYEVDLQAETFTKKVLLDRHVVSPCVDPSRAGSASRYVFCGVAHGEGPGPTGGACRVDAATGAADVWVASPTEFCSAPTFVPKPGAAAEGEGYLLTLVLDGAAGRSDVVVLDAQDVAKGPVCRFALRDAMPHSLGGATWAPGLAFTEEELQRKVTLRNLFEKKSKEWNEMNTSASLAPGLNTLFQKQGTKMR